MTYLTHIPELRDTALAALALCAFSCLALASHLHVRFFDHHGVHTLQVYAGILAAVTGSAFLILGPAALLRAPGWGLAAGLVLGTGAGPLIAAADTAITRRLGRRTASRVARPVRGPAARPQARATRPVGQAARLTGAKPTRSADRRWTPNRRDTDVALPLVWLVTVGVLEEFVFRGVLTGVAMALPGWGTRTLVLTLATAAFALSHIFFGWAQVVAKLPLSLATLAITLATGNVLGAAVAHALFNFRIWRYQATVRTAAISIATGEVAP
ncbi:CPBP family intramembrane glutamic endopeptidase [Streptomyces angustmyceticus]|uniref:CPBP family intramembrane glutamic endopeptidase n=1 Tax=Streptomyces angustmyceticus TaxID=285578 RepID=UPI0036CB90B8